MIEVCRYFFRARVLRTRLEELIEKHGGAVPAVEREWDEFWAYYSFWLAGLWVVCEGFERIAFPDPAFLARVKQARSFLHPVRQATFHFKPDTSQMMRHFDDHRDVMATAWAIHDEILDVVGQFLASLPDEYLDSLPD